MLGTNVRKVRSQLGRVGAVGALMASLVVVAATSATAQPVEPDVHGGNLVIWATDSVKLERGASVVSNGLLHDIVAQNPFVSGDQSVRLQRGASTDANTRVIGDNVRLDSGSSAGSDVYYNSLSGSGAIGGASFTPLAVPVAITDAPVFRAGTPGTADVIVGRNGSQTITPGAYRDVIVDRNATLILDGAGDYEVRSITLGRGASVEIDAGDDVEILVQRRFEASPKVSFGPQASSGLAPDNIAVYVEGATDTTEASGRIGNANTFEATMYVRMSGPELTVGSGSEVTGALFGTRVKIGENTEVTAASFFGGADLSITKTDSADPAISGEQLTYTVTVSNAGPQEATNVVVTDTLPTETTLVSTSGCTEDPNGVPTCSLGNIASGGTAQYTITVDVDAGLHNVTITNSASVTSDRFDPDASNNSVAEETLVIEPTADLSISKSDDVDPVVAGDTVLYTVTVDNAGPQAAPNVVVTDTLPAGVTLVATTGCAEDPVGVPTCSLGTIASGGSAQYTIEVTVDPGVVGTLTNAASVTSDITDPDGADNSTSEDTEVLPVADLSITKSDDVDPVVAGDTVVYTVTVDNAGPQAATNVVVTDTLPAGATLVATTGCGEDPTGVPTCSLGTIASGGSAQYTIEVTIDAGVAGTLTNAASVTSDTFDPDAGNNAATEDTVADPTADLSITKVDDVDPAFPGDTVVYTVTVANAGPQAATNVVVTDTLPAGVTLVATTGCAEDPIGVPTCSLGTIASGGSAQYTIEVTVDAGVSGTLTNDASVSSDTFDPDAGNNATTEDTFVATPTADLSIIKADDVDPNVVGGTLVYTVTVSNAGPQAASNVVVTDTLPAGVTLVATTGCAADPVGVPTCSLGTIASGGSAQYTIEVTIDSGTSGVITNNASVTSDVFDNDAGNNSTTEDTQVAAPPVAVDDAPAAASAPGDDHHTALDTTLTVVDNSSEDLLVNDDPGFPSALLVSFGGGSLGGSVTDNVVGATVAVGAGSLTVNADGTYVFTPDTDFTGLFTFDYRIENGVGSSDATVTIAVGVRPQANGDPLDAIGNVGLSTSGTFSVLTNDAGDQIAAIPAAGGTAAGGAYALASDGAFSYRPAPGFEGVDTFTYDIANGFGTVSGTVTVTVDEVIWFIDNSQGSPGNGTLASPFDSLAGFNSGAADDPGDVIFIDETGSGPYTGGITLLAGQILVGNGSSASIDAVAAITLPPHSPTLPATGGASPTVTEAAGGNGITLGTNNTVRGLNVSNSGGGAGILGSGVGTLSISEVSDVTSSGGPGVSISSGIWNIDIGTVSVPSSAAGGISLSTGGGSTATFGTVNLTTTGGTGFDAVNPGTVNITNAASTVSSTNGRAVNIDGAVGSMSFASLTSTGSPDHGLRMNSSTLTFDVSGTTTVTNRGATGVVLDQVAGTVGLGTTAVPNGLSATGDGIRIDSSSAAFTFDSLDVSDTVVGTAGTYSATTGVPTNDGDGNGVFIKNLSGSFAVNGGTIQDFADNAIDIRSSRNINLSGVTIAGNFAGNSAVQGHNVFNFSMANTTIDDLDNVDAALGVGDHGLRFIELEGTLSITGTSAITDVEGYVYSVGSTGSANRAIEVRNSQGCTVQDATGDCNLTVTIDGLTVRNFDFQGVNIRHVGGTIDVTIQNSDFDNINGAAINTGPNMASTTNTHDVDVLNNTFDNVGIAAELFSSRGGPTTAVVSGNVITGTHSDAVRLVAFNQSGSGASATFTGTVADNVMTGVAGNLSGTAAGGAGVFIAAEDAVDAQVLVENNTITGHTGTAPVAECFRTQNQRDGVLDVVFRGNSCSDFPTNFFGAVFLGNDFDTVGPTFTDTCVDFAATNTYVNTDGLLLNTFGTDSTGLSIMDLPNGFNSAEPVSHFGNAPTAGACSIAPLS